MSRYLKAKDDHTIVRKSSVGGEVSFKDGIATEFTKEQAAHFVNNLGYTLVDPDGKTGDSTKTNDSDATLKADEIIENAHKEADGIIKQAEETANKMIDDATIEAQNIKDDVKVEKEEVQKTDADTANDDTTEDNPQNNSDQKVEIPDETTPYPKLMKTVKDFGIDTKGSKKAEDVLAAILADPRFQSEPKE